MGLSRRQFVQRVSAGGGTGAAYSAMMALGLLAAPTAYAGPLVLPANAGRGVHVVVLGAGMAGLVSAYELERAGFKVTVLEARTRVGGRSWSIRGGDRIEMIGEPDQTAAFSEGLYMNAGPARLPSHHQGMLGYAKASDEVWILVNNHPVARGEIQIADDKICITVTGAANVYDYMAGS